MAIQDDFALPTEQRYREITEVLLKQVKPVTKTMAFTKSDTTDETVLARGFHCNVSGDLKILLEEDTTARTIYVTAGAYYPYRVKRVYSTGTVADITGIL